MTFWCHNICHKCWDKKNPATGPACEENGPTTICCFCSRLNRDGILVRWKGSLLKCGGECSLNQTGEIYRMSHVHTCSACDKPWEHDWKHCHTGEGKPLICADCFALNKKEQQQTSLLSPVELADPLQF